MILLISFDNSNLYIIGIKNITISVPLTKISKNIFLIEGTNGIIRSKAKKIKIDYKLRGKNYEYY